jgi:4-hydroxythreonine-4-phosphate dehydrogenase
VTKPRVGISLGDPSGIGLEITIEALAHREVASALRPVLFGDASMPEGPWERRVISELPSRDRQPGKPTRGGGLAQYFYVTAAIEAAKHGELDALCTAPVSKAAISKAGIPFLGHTEVLAEAFGCEVLMLMDGPKLRVALATNHLPITKLSRALTTPKLVAALKLLSHTLTPVLGHKPSIAVCGLNPHAGDGGIIGTEEERVIEPAVKLARRQRLDVHGPFAADGLFARAATRFPYDVALAMFHDQGLVAVKTLDFTHTVNVTLGLPVPRTSPDHGVAYDIAGKGLADETPMVAALLKAAAYARVSRR